MASTKTTTTTKQSRGLMGKPGHSAFSDLSHQDICRGQKGRLGFLVSSVSLLTPSLQGSPRQPALWENVSLSFAWHFSPFNVAYIDFFFMCPYFTHITLLLPWKSASIFSHSGNCDFIVSFLHKDKPPLIYFMWMPEVDVVGGAVNLYLKTVQLLFIVTDVILISLCEINFQYNFF